MVDYIVKSHKEPPFLTLVKYKKLTFVLSAFLSQNSL